MSNNSSEQVRQRLYEEYEDSLFKLIMHDAAEKEGRLFLEEKEKLENSPEFLPSLGAIQKFSQQLDAQLKSSKAYARRRRMGQALNRAAVAMLIVMVIFFTTVATVEAVRVRILNFLMDIQQEYTSFQLKDSSSGSEGDSATIDWHQAYVPTYIPDGYAVSATSQNENYKKIESTNSQGSLITYLELSAGHTPALDTENASVFEGVSINGHEGALVVKNSLATIIWSMHDRMFIIQAPIEKDMAVKIAEGVKYIN